jgi:hypothetical protein
MDSAVHPARLIHFFFGRERVSLGWILLRLVLMIHPWSIDKGPRQSQEMSTARTEGLAGRYFVTPSGWSSAELFAAAWACCKRYPARVRTWYFCRSFPTSLTVIVRQPVLGLGCG